MLDKLKNFAVEKGYALARAKGMRCPQCGAKLVLPLVMPDGGLDAAFDCGGCGWSGSLVDVMMEGKGGQVLMEKPAGSKIVEAEVNGAHSWIVPAKKGLGFLMVFGAFWLAFSLFMTWGFLFGNPTDADTGEPASRWTTLFFVPFIAIGVGLLYGGLRMRYTEVMLVIDAERVRMLKRFFGKVKEKSIARADVAGVWLKESYQSNDNPVYELFIENAGEGAGLGFGSQLKEDEKSWLLGRIQSALPAVEDEIGSSMDMSAGAGGVSLAEREEFDHKSIKLEKVGEGFRLTRKNTLAKWLIPMGVFDLVICGIIGGGTLSGGSGDGLFMLFNLIPLLMVSFGIIVGLALVIGGIAMMGREEVYEFGKDALEVEKRRNGVVKNRVRHQRSVFKEILCTGSGNVNNDPRYRVAIKGTGVKVTLCWFVNGEVADGLEAWLMGWLPQNASQGGYGSAISLAPEKPKAVSASRGSAIYRGKKYTQPEGAMRYLILAFPAIFMLVGGGVFYFGAKSMLSAKASEQWPSVSGVVKVSEVVENSDSDGTTYGAKVKYHYTVAGAEYDADRVKYGEVSTSNSSGAYEVVNSYPVGKKITVYHHPETPEESVLEPGIHGGTYFMPIFGLVFFTVGTLVLVLMLKQGKK